MDQQMTLKETDMYLASMHRNLTLAYENKDGKLIDALLGNLFFRGFQQHSQLLKETFKV